MKRSVLDPVPALSTLATAGGQVVVADAAAGTPPRRSKAARGPPGAPPGPRRRTPVTPCPRRTGAGGTDRTVRARRRDDRGLAEVDLGLLARLVAPARSRRRCRRVSSARSRRDVRRTVTPRPLGVVLLDQPLPDPARGVALLARRSTDRRPATRGSAAQGPITGAARGRLRRAAGSADAKRLADRAPVDPWSRARARTAEPPPGWIATDTLEQLHPRQPLLPLRWRGNHEA